jgi:mRNA-degrading endonuclease RelE of RelBE toxin-antitoxin system
MKDNEPSAYRRIRIGGYRAIYTIDWRENRILWIGHRNEIYTTPQGFSGSYALYL